MFPMVNTNKIYIKDNNISENKNNNLTLELNNNNNNIIDKKNISNFDLSNREKILRAKYEYNFTNGRGKKIVCYDS